VFYVRYELRAKKKFELCAGNRIFNRSQGINYDKVLADIGDAL
jgi:hypothetical protein